MTTENSRDSAKIPGHRKKLFVSFYALLFSPFVAEKLSAMFDFYFSNPSNSTIQVLEALEFLPILLAWSFLVRYSAQWLIHVPRLSSDTITQYEKSTVRGVLSFSILILGLGLWAWRILMADLAMHAIFTWSFFLFMLGISYSSWYYSKLNVYRRALSGGSPALNRPESQLPTPIEFFTGIKQGDLVIEEAGIDRGLPTVLFRIESKDGDDIVLNLGVERLLPTALFKQDE